jgi:hypothetical protein
MRPLPLVQCRGELTSDGPVAGPAVDEWDRRDIVAVEYVGQRIVVDLRDPARRRWCSAAVPHRGARPPTGAPGVPVWHSDTRMGSGPGMTAPSQW